jgi:glutathione synthase/RimK-type ligase-like ATP-grasp enzyme
MSIAILGAEDDEQVQAVGRELDERGVSWEVWNAGQWPGDAPLTFAATEGSTDVVLSDAVDPADVDAVYFRRISFDPLADAYADTLEERPYSLLNQLNEYRGVVLSVLQFLEVHGVAVVNPPTAMRHHSMKPYQVATFAEHGLPVPETVTTNDPAAATAFVERVGEAIYKPVAGGGHAHAASDEDLSRDQLDRLSNSPVQFQERLRGDDLRLFVVDGEVVAAGRIVSDAVDYRTDDHDVERVDPPADVAADAVEAADLLDLSFAGVDVVYDGSTDEYGILEANPSPMFAAFDRLAGTEVASHLAEFLVR